MEKTKRITLNADKRKVIADVFQDHFESNSKYKKAWQDAKENYNLLRKVAKEKIEPSRSSISILGALFGFMLGVLIVLVRGYFKED